MREIAGILRLSRKSSLKTLQKKLCDNAVIWLEVFLNEIPQSNGRNKVVSYGDRARWLRKNVLSSSVTMQKAFAFENRAWLSNFPNLDEQPFPITPQFVKIESELAKVEAWCVAMIERLDQMTSQTTDTTERPAAKPITDAKYALVYNLLELYVRIPQGRGMAKRLPTRTSESDTGGKQTIRGEFPEFVRAAAAPILGSREALDDQTRLAIAKYQEHKAT